MKKKQVQVTVTEGAAIIAEVANEWVGSGSKESIFTVTTRAAKRLSKNPLFNLAAYMKYSFPSMSGMTDNEWIESAKEAKKILGGKS